MLIKKPADIRPSEITSRTNYLNRRDFIRPNCDFPRQLAALCFPQTPITDDGAIDIGQRGDLTGFEELNNGRGLINADSIETMKDGVVIINCSRGEVIDTGALVAALHSGKVGGYGAACPF